MFLKKWKFYNIDIEIGIVKKFWSTKYQFYLFELLDLKIDGDGL